MGLTDREKNLKKGVLMALDLNEAKKEEVKRVLMDILEEQCNAG